MLVLPQGACNDWLGLAIVGGWNPADPASSDSSVWLNGGWREGVLAPFLHMHELGHTIHLGHSGYTFPDGWQDDYGDQASSGIERAPCASVLCASALLRWGVAGAAPPLPGLHSGPMACAPACARTHAALASLHLLPTRADVHDGWVGPAKVL